MNREEFLVLPVAGRISVLADLLNFGNSPRDGGDLLDQQLRASGLENESVSRMFESVVERFPNNTALVLNGEKMSYRELNQRANCVARFLLGRGTRNKYVGLFVDPSFEMIIAVVGILKAGFAYVPIDVKNAKGRIRSILEDVDLDLILTKSKLLDKLPPSSATTVCFDSSRDLAEGQEGNPDTLVRGKDCAYVIFTSGSTGRPKGVPISHYNIVHLFRSTDQLFDFSHMDVWTCFHSISFDFSVWEIWGALLKGGTLVIVPFSASRNYPKFFELLVREKVTVLNQTPTAFRLLIQTDAYLSSESNKHSLRYVILGGEALNISCLKPWFDKYGEDSTAIVNMYGITETTVHVTFRRIYQRDLDSQESLIGSPLPGLLIYLLDQEGKPVPFGEEGEMYIGGLGLSQGYLNREELTKQRFVQNPFLSMPGARLYRSGDLGRFKSNGELCHLGRIDNQVQIRGYRVELGEIESAMRDVDFVRDAVAFVQRDSSSDPKIVIVYQSDSEVAVPHKEIRELLEDRLPEYMLPDFSIRVEEFPLNKNGKLDQDYIAQTMMGRLAV